MAPARPDRDRGARGRRAVASLLLVALTVAMTACGGEEPSGGGAASFAAEASHVHGLGVNPADDSLLIATHGGLFRAGDSETPGRVGETGYDLMGFTVAGPDRFLASGHPPPGAVDPPHLGLVESTDAGQSWEEISLGGRADFHVLRHSGGTIYGFNGLDGLLLISDDDGASWRSEQVPAPLFDLAVHPEDPTRFVASTEAGLYEATASGKKWRQIEGSLGLLAWPEATSLFLADGEGRISASANRGRSWRPRGELPEAPAVLYAASATELYAAMPEGTIVLSLDGGRSWKPRVQP